MKKKTQNKDKEVLAFIKVIRDSFHDTHLVYSYGGCYGFYKILKHIYPTAKPYFEDDGKKHIMTKIGDDFYDIKGLYDIDDGKPVSMTSREVKEWKDCAAGQRLEWMLAKYNKMCKDYQKD